ncbi:MAG: glycosyltransferase [Planctomyces sp.]|nr:glycosyltransferase [Planctomyces sp.]
MPSNPEPPLVASAAPASSPDCVHRRIVSRGSSPDSAGCALAARLVGLTDAWVSLPPGACDACQRQLAPPEQPNPVVASLAYQHAGELLATLAAEQQHATEDANGSPEARFANGRADADGPRHLALVRERLLPHLSYIHAALPETCLPPAIAAPAAASPKPASLLRWQVGVLTAPRGDLLLPQTLASLREAGFDELTVFAEPGADVPADSSLLRVVRRERRLGNIANFYAGLSELFASSPDADCYAMFQDDITIAAGTRDWCESELWPGGAGLVSLFTPLPHTSESPGWRLLSPGFFRVYGGQALLFRGDVLRQFLADPEVLRAVHANSACDDAIVAGWAARRAIPIAYHTPSLVQHHGRVSSISEDGHDRRVRAHATTSISRIADWRRPPRGPGRIGLVGHCTATGVGYQTLDFARNLPIDRWLIPDHSLCPTLPTDGARGDVACCQPRLGLSELRRWLRGLDWVVFIERPWALNVVEAARIEQVNIACVPNWECLSPGLDWLACVDLMLCPTRHTFRLLEDWKRRYGFGWDLECVPWPIDAKQFLFRQRTTCRRFLYVNGWGGGRARRIGGDSTPYGRKGLELIVGAARAAPELDFLVHSQERSLGRLPRNIELRPAPQDPVALYAEGDVCVQPSHWEGLGLQLLECQASGLPLITSDAPPMNEFEPLATIPVSDWEHVHISGDQPAPSALMSPEAIAELLLSWRGRDIAQASRDARAFIEREHDWSARRSILERSLSRF